MNFYTFFWILFLLLTECARALGTNIDCIECSSVEDDFNCPADGGAGDTKKVGCSLGACYTTLETINGKVESMRGCTNDLEDMPNVIPPEGAYTWKEKTINICWQPTCNAFPPEESSGTSIYENDGGTIECYECMNYDSEGNHYSQCPLDGVVDPDKAYSGKCNTTCFTRTFADDPKKVARGCTDSQWGMPYPLPPEGCYNWEKGVWCICNTSECNVKAIGKSSGKELDDHLYEDTNEVFEEEDGLNRCFECINYDSKGTYYKQCPKHKRVRNAFLSVCNGSCFTHSYDFDDRKVARGCTATQWGLPDPLPPDGCYKWYSEVWCVCSKTRCNRHPIGKAQDIEFDAHIKKSGKGAQTTGTAIRSSGPLVMSCLFLVLFRWLYHSHFTTIDATVLL